MSALLPSVAPERIEDAPVREILPMLSLSEVLRDPSVKTRLAVFDPAKLDRGWRPFLATPAPKAVDGSVQPDAGPFDGKVVGVRRQVGFGHMTLVGVDIEELSSRALQVPTLPQGDVFWNRVLGRRADTPSGGEYTALAESTRLVTSGGVSAEIGENKLVSETIGLAGQAAIGVLAASAAKVAAVPPNRGAGAIAPPSCLANKPRRSPSATSPLLTRGWRAVSREDILTVNACSAVGNQVTSRRHIPADEPST